MGTSSAWTSERRARQAEVIQRSQPWRRSTGPKTAKGKRRSSKNSRYSGPNADEYFRILAELEDGKLVLQLLGCLMKREGKRIYGEKRYPRKKMTAE